MNNIKSEATPVYAAGANDEQIIQQAIALLEKQIRRKGDAFTDPATVKTFLKFNLVRLEHEEFAVMFLDNKHRLIEYKSLFRGTIDGASVYPREVAKEALKLNAAAVILAHNHPSGVADPSEADKKITNKLKDALGLLDIRVLDHFVVGEADVYSFVENGVM